MQVEGFRGRSRDFRTMAQSQTVTMLTVKDVVEITGLSEKTIHRYIRAGDGYRVVIGNFGIQARAFPMFA